VQPRLEGQAKQQQQQQLQQQQLQQQQQQEALKMPRSKPVLSILSKLERQCCGSMTSRGSMTSQQQRVLLAPPRRIAQLR
jgi:hypothetical protein